MNCVTFGENGILDGIVRNGQLITDRIDRG